MYILLTVLLFYEDIAKVTCKSVYLVCISDRNTSGLVAAEFSLLFSQEFHMRRIDKLYRSLYQTRHLGLTPIDVINDTSKY